MAKNDQEEAFEKFLSANLARVIDFVKFAETKNAALLTFSSAWILASVNVYNSQSTTPEWKNVFLCIIPVFTISAITAIVSFFPRINLDCFHKDPERSKSLLFFGDIASFSPESFRDRVAKRYFPPDEHSVTQNFCDDMAIQIHVNSCIAVRKFNLFKIGASIAAFGVLCVSWPIFIRVIGFLSAALTSAPKP